MVEIVFCEFITTHTHTVISGNTEQYFIRIYAKQEQAKWCVIYLLFPCNFADNVKGQDPNI